MVEKVVQHDIMHDDAKAPGLPVYAGSKKSDPKWIELDMGYLKNYHAMSATIKIHMPTDRAAMWDLVMRTTNAPKPALSRQSALQELANYSDPLTEEKLIGQEELRQSVETLLQVFLVLKKYSKTELQRILRSFLMLMLLSLTL